MNYIEENIREDYRKLTKLLIEKGMTITTMESCTGGQIASLITDTEGSSSVIKGAFVTYCNEAKIMQGVPAEIINRYSVYSEETAVAMAKACQDKYKSDIGIGVTGTMGNVDPANSGSSIPGRVYFAISYGDKVVSFYKEISHKDSRLMYKLAVAKEIYDELMNVVFIKNNL